MRIPLNGNLGLKLIALLLAILLYYSLKTSSTSRIMPGYEGRSQQQH